MNTTRCPHCNQMHRQGARFCPMTGKPIPSPESAIPPAESFAGLTGKLPANYLLKDRYLIVRKVGQGGMAAVYQAIDTQQPGAHWAIKEMSDAALSAKDRDFAVHSFLTEANLLRSLRHINLPVVVDVFAEGGKHYLVMEFVQGKSLQDLLRQRGAPFTEVEVLPWAIQLCEVLAYLHSRTPKIIFRDIKPSNIMLTPDGRIKLIDFGIARFFKPGKTTDTMALGTPGYASPEAVSGQTDERSDIYSLCITLHQLLTLHDPLNSLFNPPPLRSLNPAVTIQMEQIISRGLQNQRERRWQSAKELQTEFTQLLHITYGAAHAAAYGAPSAGRPVVSPTPMRISSAGAASAAKAGQAQPSSLISTGEGQPASVGAGLPPTHVITSRPTTRLLAVAAQLSAGQMAMVLAVLALFLVLGVWILTPALNAMSVNWNNFPLVGLFGALGYAAYPRRGVTFASHVILSIVLVGAIWLRLPYQSYGALWLFLAAIISGAAMEIWVAFLPRLKRGQTTESWRSELIWLSLMEAIGTPLFLVVVSRGVIEPNLIMLLVALILGAAGWFLGDLTRQYLLFKRTGSRSLY